MEKKKQHFIPKFYLKNFSYQNDRESIGIWTINSKKYIPRGNLDNQCYKNYFYGRDNTLENAFEKLENDVAKIISSIINKQSIPIRDSKEYYLLLVFIISLSLRTESSANDVNETVDKMLKMAYKYDTRVNTHLNEINISTPDASVLTLTALESSVCISEDLGCRLIINDTNRKFLTSDNPVIIHNQFFIKDRTNSHLGFGCRGLQIIVPISPITYLFFYDQDVYGVGRRKDTVFNISEPNDVDTLNSFQYFNAEKTLYFDDSVSENYIQRIIKDSQRFRKNSKVVVREYEIPTSDANKKQSIIHSYSNITYKDLLLTFVRILKKAKRVKFGNTSDLYRNPELLHYLMRNEELRILKRK